MDFGNYEVNGYDYLIVGAGLYGAIVARELAESGKRCLVIDRRVHVAGTAYTEKVNDIDVHVFGAHIFHSGKTEWDYLNKFAEFENYVNSPIAVFLDEQRLNYEVYNLPFNMNTFSRIFNTPYPDKVKSIISKEIYDFNGDPSIDHSVNNLENKAISLVGTTIYNKLIKGYTEKQWGRKCTELDGSIITRLPVRFTYDNNYFDDEYQGIPVNGYTDLVTNILCHGNIRVNLGLDYNKCSMKGDGGLKKVIYTGRIDEFFKFKHGVLDFRGLNFNTQEMDYNSYQGTAVMNYTSSNISITRSIEHKYFKKNPVNNGTTVLTLESSSDNLKDIGNAYYPISDKVNKELFLKYKGEEATFNGGQVVFGGRLGDYKYYNMDVIVRKALEMSKEIIEEGK